MIPPFNAAGSLPRGRWVTDMDETHDALVLAEGFAGSVSRASFWAKFVRAIDSVRKRQTPVVAGFLSGSFATAKMDPGDIDVALIVDVSNAHPVTVGALNALFKRFRDEAKIDLFMIPWHPDGSQNGAEPGYLEARGKWDDFWQRDVPKDQRSTRMREHAMPVRGYLEVVIDGYR